jgi:hypothetical protein
MQATTPRRQLQTMGPAPLVYGPVESRGIHAIWLEYLLGISVRIVPRIFKLLRKVIA